MVGSSLVSLFPARKREAVTRVETKGIDVEDKAINKGKDEISLLILKLYIKTLFPTLNKDILSFSLFIA